MKKIFLFAIVPALLFSCKKETTTPNPDPVVTENGLEAWFKFSANYKDATGKATAVNQSGVSFTTDRKGNASAAVQFDGTGGINLSNVFLKGQAVSVSVWIAKDQASYNAVNYFIIGAGVGINQYNTGINGVIAHPGTNYVPSDCPDMNWHHYVLTFDGVDIRYYKDGVSVGVTNHPGSFNDGKKTFTIGFDSNTYWKGRIDELKFYSRVLTAGEITQLSKD